MGRRAVLVLGVLSAPAWGAPPVLNNVVPHGAKRGESLLVQFSGPGVGLGTAELIGRVPGAWSEIVPKGPNALQAKLTLSPDAPTGATLVAVRTEKGLTAPKAFWVDELSAAKEAEPNDAPTSAMALALPAVVEGACAGTDRDMFRLRLKAGESIVAEALAARIGSALEPALTVRDANGRLLPLARASREGDPLASLTAPTEGEYVLTLEDLNYETRGPAFYRLRVEGPVAPEGPLPSVWRGPAEASSSEGERWLEVGTSVEGRIGAPGEVDAYRVKARPGQALRVTARALGPGSPLDAVLSVVGPGGLELGRGDDESGLDPNVSVKVPTNAEEVEVRVRDLIGRGGPGFGYRLLVAPDVPDFALEVTAPAITVLPGGATTVNVAVERLGFAGPIQLSLAGDVEGLDAGGGLVAANAKTGQLVLTAREGSAPRALKLEIWGQGGADALPLRRRATWGAPLVRDFEAIPAAIGAAPPIAFHVATTELTVPHGYEAKFQVKAVRPKGHKGTIEVAAVGAPKALTGGTLKLEGEAVEGTIEFGSNDKVPLGPLKVVLSAKAKVDGADETIALPALTLNVVRPYDLELLNPTVVVAPGATVNLELVARRVPPFAGAIEVAPAPGGPTAAKWGPITIAPGSRVAVLPLTIDAGAPEGELALTIQASADVPGRRTTKGYQHPDLSARAQVRRPSPPARP